MMCLYLFLNCGVSLQQTHSRLSTIRLEVKEAGDKDETVKTRMENFCYRFQRSVHQASLAGSSRVFTFPRRICGELNKIVQNCYSASNTQPIYRKIHKTEDFIFSRNRTLNLLLCFRVKIKIQAVILSKATVIFSPVLLSKLHVSMPHHTRI